MRKAKDLSLLPQDVGVRLHFCEEFWDRGGLMVIIRYVQIGPPNQHWLNYFIFANPLFLSRRIQYRRPQLKALTLLWGSRTPPQGCFPTHLYLLYLPALFSPSLRHTAVCNIDGPRLCLSHSSRTRLCNRNDPSFDRRPYNIPDISTVVDRWAFFYSCERQNMLDRKNSDDNQDKP